MRKRSAIGFFIVALCIGGPLVHYGNEVRVARNATPQLINAAFSTFGKDLQLADLPAFRRELLLSVEDPLFDTHLGVDLETPGAGMTTITQGLVKLLYYPDGFQQGIAKIRQTLIARYALDDLVSKDDQLLLFLNITYFGDVDGVPVHGFSKAAKTYFNKSFVTLTDDEFLALVGMLISPNTLKPDSPLGKARLERVKTFLAGAIKPAGLLDVEYVGQVRGTFAEEMLVSFLRVVTRAW
jgi:hypothetical protein